MTPERLKQLKFLMTRGLSPAEARQCIDHIDQQAAEISGLRSAKIDIQSIDPATIPSVRDLLAERDAEIARLTKLNTDLSAGDIKEVCELREEVERKDEEISRLREIIRQQQRELADQPNEEATMSRMSEAEIAAIDLDAISPWRLRLVAKQILDDREAILAELAAVERAYGSLIDACNKAFGERPCHAEIVARIFEVQAELAAVKAELAEAKRLCERHAAEVNRRRGEMAVARSALDEAGVPKETGGITLTMSQRINILRSQMP